MTKVLGVELKVILERLPYALGYIPPEELDHIEDREEYLEKRINIYLPTSEELIKENRLMDAVELLALVRSYGNQVGEKGAYRELIEKIDNAGQKIGNTNQEKEICSKLMRLNQIKNLDERQTMRSKLLELKPKLPAGTIIREYINNLQKIPSDEVISGINKRDAAIFTVAYAMRDLGYSRAEFNIVMNYGTDELQINSTKYWVNELG
ncbi:hypothetical protein HY990_01300 [Candidatus Micrarchaeota archaeon]|nr:hypothetical protein [Candidatus Micrarchaeota archaeon]